MKFFVTITLLALAVQASSAATMEELLGEIKQIRQLLEDITTELRSPERHPKKEEPKPTSKKQEPKPSEICGNCIRSDCRSLAPKTDCLEHLHNCGKVSGLYVVHLNINARIEVYCDQQTDGGGWTVFQRRKDGSVEFYRNWDDYKKGFGDPANEYWLGNDYIHVLTIPESELRIEMEDWDNKVYFEKYNMFQVGDEQTKYMLEVSGPTGSAGDGGKGLLAQNDMKFSTYDNDNDAWPNDCAKYNKGGWWYKDCSLVHLNGYYNMKDEHADSERYGRGITWYPISPNYHIKLKFAEMKTRRKQ